MKDTKQKAVELSGEELAQVSGGDLVNPPATGIQCSKGYTECTEANCLNPKCSDLSGCKSQYCIEYRCSRFVSGSFKIDIDPVYSILHPSFNVIND